jgi:SAM-dependent methyltransferase
MTPRVPRRVRKCVFGRNPEAYARARLPYPDGLFEILTNRCGLHAGAAVFEIGPGTGIASRELLRRGASPLTLIEPDRRLARYLRSSLDASASRLRMIEAPFEKARLPPRSFDLGVAASSFHWLPERTALRKVARALKPGGWWASWNQHHGDATRPSAFHDALQPLYRGLSGGRDPGRYTKAVAVRDRAARLRALRSVGRFDRISREDLRWKVTLSGPRVSALWGTFSDIVTLPAAQRRRFLAGLERVIATEFGGRVTIPMLTPLYLARRI